MARNLPALTGRKRWRWRAQGDLMPDWLAAVWPANTAQAVLCRLWGHDRYYDGQHWVCAWCTYKAGPVPLCPMCNGPQQWCEVCALPRPCCPTLGPEPVLMPGQPTVCLIDHGTTIDGGQAWRWRR